MEHSGILIRSNGKLIALQQAASDVILYLLVIHTGHCLDCLRMEIFVAIHKYGNNHIKSVNMSDSVANRMSRILTELACPTSENLAMAYRVTERDTKGTQRDLPQLVFPICLPLQCFCKKVATYRLVDWPVGSTFRYFPDH